MGTPPSWAPILASATASAKPRSCSIIRRLRESRRGFTVSQREKGTSSALLVLASFRIGKHLALNVVSSIFSVNGHGPVYRNST